MPNHERHPMQSSDRLTRRGALGRLLTLGAGATAVLALPVPAQAATMEPTDPAWLATALSSLTSALRSIPADTDVAHRDRYLRIGLSFFDTVCSIAGDPAADEPQPLPPVRPRLIPSERVVMVQFHKLDRNARRRAQRWIARQPIGEGQPLLRLRAGAGSERPSDFLDVAVPASAVDRGWQSPVDYAIQTVGRLNAGITPRGHDLVIPWSRHSCVHTSDVGGQFMAAYPDGRLTVYLSELG